MIVHMSDPIPAEVIAHCAASLRVLAHPVRLRIAELLTARRLSVGELSAALGVEQAVVSQHLTRMRNADLLTVERQGRLAFYRVTSPSCTAVLDCIRRTCS